MANVRTNSSSNQSNRPRRHALTPEVRENQMINLAVDLAERQLREGTASSQVITHFLKLASTKAELEKERLIEENKLLRAKTENLQQAKRVDEMYEEAIKAMKRYGGYGDTNDD